MLALSVTRAVAQTAEDPRTVQPERPTVATHAGTVAPGYLEVEAGGEHDRFAPGTALDFAPIVLKFGTASHVQTNVFYTQTGRGLADAGVGVKWRLVDDAPLLGDFAMLPSVKFPTGDPGRGSGTGSTDASLLLISSHKFGDLAMDLNVGATRHGRGDFTAPYTSTVWTASFGGPFAGPVGWVGELYGYPGYGGSSGNERIVAFLAGPTLQLRNFLAVDAGIIVPVAGPQPHAIFAGGVYNVGRLW